MACGLLGKSRELGVDYVRVFLVSIHIRTAAISYAIIRNPGGAKDARAAKMV